MAVRAVDREGERELALRQREKIRELDAEILFDGRDELLVELGHELVMKRLHRVAVPKHHLRRDLAGGAERIGVRHGEERQRVRRQEIFRRRDVGADGQAAGTKAGGAQGEFPEV